MLTKLEICDVEVFEKCLKFVLFTKCINYINVEVEKCKKKTFRNYIHKNYLKCIHCHYYCQYIQV